MKNLLLSSVAICALFTGAAFAQTQNKKVTIVNAHTTADGSSQVTESPLEECVESLPSPRDLEAVVKSSSEYLKEINGESGKNERIQVYSATVTVSFKVRQTFVLIVTTNSIEGQAPDKSREVRSKVLTKTFESDPGGGDIYAGRSRRKYYYSTAEAAANSAKAQAEAWIKQQQNVMCPPGK
jgi:predicted Zn-dependent protease